MDINKVIMEYDNMFGKYTLEEIDAFLENKIEEANREQDFYSMVTLLNEHMSFCRDISNKDKGLIRCEQVIAMLNSLKLKGTVEYATSLINVANAYRAFGVYDKSLELFTEVEGIYKEKLAPGEYNYASLYNNWSLLYQEMGHFEQAAHMLRKAMQVIDKFPQAAVSQAVTRSNLAVTLLRISKNKAMGAEKVQVEEQLTGVKTGLNTDELDTGEQDYREAMNCLMEALGLFEENAPNDFHYSAAIAAMGDALYMKEDYVGAIEYYERALAELERTVGKSDAYNRVLKNLQDARTQLEYKNDAKKEKEEAETTVQLSLNADYVKESCGVDVKEATQVEDKKTSVKEPVDAGVSGFSGNPHIFNNNMERCFAFYKKYGIPMIHEYFPEYERRIAVGLVGEGSDCFGYDDDISMDHDYGIGFCMWLTDEDYAKIGADLQEKYEKLIASKADDFFSINTGAHDTTANMFMDKRRGTMRIRDFYEDILRVRLLDTDSRNVMEETSWLFAEDENLATVVNGMVFRDDLGEFTAIRNKLLAYYPRKVWLLKLAKELHGFSQYAQCNYARMMARKDYVSANLCVSKGIESGIRIAYILGRKYSPYYKWLNKGSDKLTKLKNIFEIADAIATTKLQRAAWTDKKYNPYEINQDDRVLRLFEEMAESIADELMLQGIVEEKNTFLDSHVQYIINKANSMPMDSSEEEEVDEVDKTEDKKREIVEEIVLLEWNQFDKVKNEGGRADCQDDWNTFSLMRRSQYLAWPEELLMSYKIDLQEADLKGWNLIMEKYARMMKSTTPARYEELKDSLPERSAGREDIAEEIIKIQVQWMEEFASKYPKMAGNSRSIHTSEDNPFNTSYETYLRGELGTYSEETFIMYGRFIVDLKKKGENLAYQIMNNTAVLYGYKDVDDAESKL